MAAARESIPNIPLVILDVVLGQYLPVLILERQSAMMLALVGDVVFLDCHRACQGAGDVKMVVAAADFVRRTFDVATSASEIFAKLRFNFNVDPPLAVLGAEDQMQNEVR
jgi:hypothetical protein